jgi:hypothetical protein
MQRGDHDVVDLERIDPEYSRRSQRQPLVGDAPGTRGDLVAVISSR